MIYDDFQAGPGTIAEAMIRGLPIILNDYIAGQVFSLATHCMDCFVPLFLHGADPYYFFSYPET